MTTDPLARARDAVVEAARKHVESIGYYALDALSRASSSVPDPSRPETMTDTATLLRALNVQLADALGRISVLEHASPNETRMRQIALAAIEEMGAGLRVGDALIEIRDKIASIEHDLDEVGLKSLSARISNIANVDADYRLRKLESSSAPRSATSFEKIYPNDPRDGQPWTEERVETFAWACAAPAAPPARPEERGEAPSAEVRTAEILDKFSEGYLNKLTLSNLRWNIEGSIVEAERAARLDAHRKALEEAVKVARNCGAAHTESALQSLLASSEAGGGR